MLSLPFRFPLKISMYPTSNSHKHPILINHFLPIIWGFPGGARVKDLPAKAGDPARLLDQEDPLEKGMATNSSILAWKIPWTEEPGRLQTMELQRVRHN